MCNSFSRLGACARLLSAAFVLAACQQGESPVTPDRPSAHAIATVQPAGRGADAWFANVAIEVPGFGGLFFVDGRLHVNLTDPSQRQRAAEVIRRELSSGAISQTAKAAEV